MERPNFITDVVNLDEELAINVKVFSKYSDEDYDTLDQLAKEKGYFPVEPKEDEHIATEGCTGIGNSDLHCGWVCTVDDSMHKAIDMLKALNKKIQFCKQEKGEDIIVGFCQTGHFSIGYTIYVKDELTPAQQQFHETIEAIKDLENKLQIKVLRD